LIRHHQPLRISALDVDFAVGVLDLAARNAIFYHPQA